MHTARLPNIHASVATRCQHWWGVGPQVNKFEQVFGLGHQMSWGQALVQRRPSIVGNGNNEPPSVDRYIDTT